MANSSVPKITQSQSADVDAPAQSVYAVDPPERVEKDGKWYYVLKHILPSFDAKDGGNAPLTGLGNAFGTGMPFSGGPENNPYTGLTGPQCYHLQGSQTDQQSVTPAQAGATLEHWIEDTNIGGNMAFSMWTDDGTPGAPPTV